jgi:DNA repair protein RadA/Sms
MARPRTLFRCRGCGRAEPRWVGRCPACGAWSSYEEEEAAPVGESRDVVAPALVERLVDVPRASLERLATGIAELDRVLGGGFVPGSLVLLGGDPGIGKSSLLLAAAAAVAAQGPVLYATAEESAEQVRIRARRLGIDASNLYLAAEARAQAIAAAAAGLRPRLLIVDSIQAVEIEAGGAGTPSEIRACASRFLDLAKQDGIATVLVGHVTKDGALAGPKTLEHLVDTVLSFEGERGHSYRVLRGVKNRFGSTQEIGVFEMTAEGLREVQNPSALFLAERPLGVPGSCVVACAEGSRPLLVEVQAILSGTPYGTPRRTATGFDAARAALLLAVLEKRAGLAVAGLDAFINVAGGIRVQERAADLGVVAAAASSHLGCAVDSRTAVFGEVGLAGEVRAVGQVEVRLVECERLGFARCVVPWGASERARGALLEVVPVRSVREALGALGIRSVRGSSAPPR